MYIAIGDYHLKRQIPIIEDNLGMISQVIHYTAIHALLKKKHN